MSAALLAGGPATEAATLTAEAISLAAKTDAVDIRAEAFLADAEVRGAVDCAGARASCLQALALYRRRDHAVGLARAEQVLRELDAGAVMASDGPSDYPRAAR